MSRILFVDDEPRILDGLRRMLRAQRHEWEMTFALGGPAALAELAAAEFDVIVTDMRMPGIDGVHLLREASRIRPSAARVVLSGQTEQALAVHAASVAHQFIVKPSSSEAVRAVIQRVCRVRGLLPEEELQAAVGRVHAIPVLAATHAALTAAFAGPDPSAERLTRLVEGDPGMTAKLLQLVSSAFLGAPREMTGVADAIRLIGVATVRELFESGEVLVPVDSTARDLRGFGALLMSAPDWPRSPTRCGEGADDLAARVGAYLLGLWNLPTAVVEAVACAPLPLLNPPTSRPNRASFAAL